MSASTLQETWFQLNNQYATPTTAVSSTFDLLMAAYQEPHRHYHTLSHLQQLLSLQQQYADSIRDQDTITYAIFFHDIIYHAQSTANEEESAAVAVNYLHTTRFPTEKIILVKDFILATISHINTAQNPDLDYFLDFDLQILAAGPASYHAYAQQIRQEYNIYPDEIYHPGRKKVLQHFLEMPAIYRTSAFRNLYETQARYNIQAELTQL